MSHYFASPQTEGAVNQVAILMAPITTPTRFPSLPAFVTSGTQWVRGMGWRLPCNEVMDREFSQGLP
jgi:hypothetical protein